MILLLILLLPIIAFLTLAFVLVNRWGRPRPVPDDLRRADEAHGRDAPDADEVFGRINTETIIMDP
jgi:hypothetical protein